MASDELVSAHDVLRAIQEVRRLGIDRLLSDWEAREPDLTEHLLEGISEVHRQIARIAPHPKAERQLTRRIERLILVLLIALRRALLRQWQGEEDGTDLRDPKDQPVTDPEDAHGDESAGGASAS